VHVVIPSEVAAATEARDLLLARRLDPSGGLLAES